MDRRLFLSTAALGLMLASASARAEDVLNVGAYPTNPPFETKQTDGSFQGFEVDVVNEAAKRAGFKTEIADYGFQALFAAIASKRIDVAISSITITPERLKSVSFTQPYYDSDMGMATKTDSPLNKVAELKGKTIGFLSGSTGEKWVSEHQASDGFGDIKGYKSYPNMLLDLSSGRLDAVVSDIPGMQYAFKSMSGLTVKERIKTGEQYGLMTPKDDANLVKLSDAIGAMKKDGALTAIHKKWFGVEPPAGSSTVTEAPIPK